MNKTIQIYQSVITNEDYKELDPDFIVNDWRNNPTPELREIAIFFDIFDSARYRSADYVGVVSKKFNKKTKIKGKEFIEFINTNPGYDVYFINPFPQNIYFSFNVWEHGEICHPGICEATQYLFDQAKVPIKIDQLERHNHDNLLYCNYWVGSAKFWENYIHFLRKLYSCIENEMPAEKKKIFFDNTVHDGGYAPFFPFIFERLFSTYLTLYPETKYLGYEHSDSQIEKACLNDAERKIYQSFGKLIDEMDSKNRNSNVLKKTTKGLSNLLPHIREVS